MIGAALRAERGVALHDRVALARADRDRSGSQLRRSAAGDADAGAHRRDGVGREAAGPPAALDAIRAPGRRRGHRRRRRRHVDRLVADSGAPAASSLADTVALRRQRRTAGRCRALRRSVAATTAPVIPTVSRSATSTPAAEQPDQHRAAGRAGELRGRAQRIFRSAVAAHGAARPGGQRSPADAVSAPENDRSRRRRTQAMRPDSRDAGRSMTRRNAARLGRTLAVVRRRRGARRRAARNGSSA